MLQETVARVSPPVRPDRVLVVVGQQHALLARRQLANRRGIRVLVEPVGRNTAPAIALAALQIARTDPHAVMTVLPADHAIPTLRAFRADLARAATLAERTGALVTLGIPPTHPETGYGYVEPGRAVPRRDGGGHWVGRFIEKPNLARARRLLSAGRALWNAGIFVWRVDAILDALRTHLPGVVAPLERAVARGTPAALRAAYALVPSISIDYGVLEHASRVAVVRASFRWSDVGSWAAVEPFWRQRGAANAARGQVVAVDAHGCVVDSPDRLVALLGVRDLVVVDTGDAILVCPKNRAQDVRQVVDALRRLGQDRYL
jgi:mannose-1-phosphate guanylyltransferase/mannose-6-phosphate isomerase